MGTIVLVLIIFVLFGAVAIKDDFERNLAVGIIVLVITGINLTYYVMDGAFSSEGIILALVGFALIFINNRKSKKIEK